MERVAFNAYLKNVKKSSPNTISAYLRDAKEFDIYMADIGKSWEDATKTDIVSYMLKMDKEGKSRSTQNRRLAAIRAYFNFLIKSGKISMDPTEGIKSTRPERKELEYLSVEEVERILTGPDDSIKGKRDRAILEVMYGTGIRVLETIDMNYDDVDMRIGFVTCDNTHGRPRIIPLGRYAKKALSDYLTESRPALMHKEKAPNKAGSPLFVNYMGKRLTRQGLWKLIKYYGEKAGLGDKISPYILRNSFAVHMAQNGADMKTLQELLGYDDVQAMQVLVQVTKNRIKDVYDKTFPRA
jgi:integrase/recombinase XerD